MNEPNVWSAFFIGFGLAMGIASGVLWILYYLLTKKLKRYGYTWDQIFKKKL